MTRFPHDRPGRIDFNDVRQRAEGNWDLVFRALAPELETAMRRAPRHVGCPVHGGKDGFRFFGDWQRRGGGICNTCSIKQPTTDGFKLLTWLRGWDIKTAFTEVAQVLRCEPHQAPARPHRPVSPPARVVDPERSAKRRQALRKAWDESFALDENEAAPALRYLTSRGLAALVAWPDALRFHPQLDYWHVDEDDRIQHLGRFPAILAVMTDADGQAVTMHRIYITAEGGKAPVPEVKKIMTRPDELTILGAAIRLGLPGPLLNVAEGLETALAVMEITGMPCWACYSATILQSFHPPLGVRVVCVWGDKDASTAGETAGEVLITRLRAEGTRAVGFLPPDPIPPGAKGVDWLDVLADRKRRGANVASIFRPLQVRIQQLLSPSGSAQLPGVVPHA